MVTNMHGVHLLLFTVDYRVIIKTKIFLQDNLHLCILCLGLFGSGSADNVERERTRRQFISQVVTTREGLKWEKQIVE